MDDEVFTIGFDAATGEDYIGLSVQKHQADIRAARIAGLKEALEFAELEIAELVAHLTAEEGLNISVAACQDIAHAIRARISSLSPNVEGE